jgi:hypothetical protein
MLVIYQPDTMLFSAATMSDSSPRSPTPSEQAEEPHSEAVAPRPHLAHGHPPEPLPRGIEETSLVRDRSGLKWCYAVKSNEECISAYREKLIPVNLKYPVCFWSQEELRAVHGVHSQSSKCSRCGYAKDKHITSQAQQAALALYDKWVANSTVPSDEDSDAVLEIGQDKEHKHQTHPPSQHIVDQTERIRELEQLLQQREHELQQQRQQQQQPKPFTSHVPRNDNLVPLPTHPVSPSDQSVPVTIEFHKVLSTISKQLESIKWSNQSSARDFIDALDMTLLNSPLPRNQYIHLIPMMIPPKYMNMVEYINTNISHPLVSWDTAKTIFLQHYQAADWEDTYKREYNTCVQRSKESVQQYADRFSTLCNRLRYTDDNPVNIENFIQRLQPNVQIELTRYRSRLRDVNPTWVWTSLQQVIQKAIEFDVLLNSMSATRRKSSSSPEVPTSTSSTKKKGLKRLHPSPVSSSGKALSKAPSKASTTSSKPKKCRYHPLSSSHSTSDCRSQQQLSKDRDKVLTCFSCGEVGHISPNCPKAQTKQGPAKKLSKPTLSTTPQRRGQSKTLPYSSSGSKAKSIKAKAISFYQHPEEDLDPSTEDEGLSNDQ